MAHMVETMAYAGEVPWHGLGVQVEDNLTPDEMLVAAGLDWTVSKRHMFTHTTPQYNESDPEFMPVDGFHVLVRDNDQKAFGPCGPDFIPTQNRDAFTFFKKFTDAGDMKMETAGSLKEGKQVWGLAKINDGFVLPGDDKVEGYMLVAVSHQWGKSNEIRFTPIRVVCNNTLSLAMSQEGQRGVFKMPHIRAFDEEIISSAELALGLASNKMGEYKEQAEFLTTKKYKKDDVVTFIADLLQPNLLTEQIKLEHESDVRKIAKRQTMVDEFKKTPSMVYEALEQQPGADMLSSKGTWWGAYNAVTFVVDHKWGYDRDSAVHNAWFGSRSKLKERALDKAIEYAKTA